MISVIMPTYNRGHIIQRAVDSILSQSFQDFEIIIVDDASTDNTGDVIRGSYGDDARIRYIKNQKNSRAHTIQWEPRNDGLRLAEGEFIAYLDSDNSWDTYFLEKMSGMLINAPSAFLAYCNSTNHYASVDQLKLVRSQDKRNLKNFTECPPRASFSCSTIGHGVPGIDWYIDTNEIFHRASVFDRLWHLWPTFHPKRKAINRSQIISRPYRRHNDQYFVEKVIEEFGLGAIVHCDEELTNFYYFDTESD